MSIQPWSRRASVPGVGKPATRPARNWGPGGSHGGRSCHPVLGGLGETILKQGGLSLEDPHNKPLDLKGSGNKLEDLKGAGDKPENLKGREDAGGSGQGGQAAKPS